MLISVIIPVYNAEKTINRCIASVKKQKYANWEIIAVDDGSIDNSFRVLDEISRGDERIHVFHQKNGGAGVARNTGIANASGEYIVFLDSDDELDDEYFMLLAKKDADVVFIDVERKNIETSKIINEKMSIYKDMDKDIFLRAQMTGKILWGGVRKAVKRQLLTDNNILFSKQKVGEEAIYSFLILYYAKSIDFIEKTVYTYFEHSDSLSHSKLDDPWGGVEKELRQVILELDLYDNYKDTLNAFAYVATIVSLDRLSNNYKYKNYLKKASKRIKEYYDEIGDYKKIDYFSVDTRAKLLRLFMKYRCIRILFLVCRFKEYIRRK